MMSKTTCLPSRAACRFHDPAADDALSRRGGLSCVPRRRATARSSPPTRRSAFRSPQPASRRSTVSSVRAPSLCWSVREMTRALRYTVHFKPPLDRTDQNEDTECRTEVKSSERVIQISRSVRGSTSRMAYATYSGSISTSPKALSPMIWSRDNESDASKLVSGSRGTPGEGGGSMVDILESRERLSPFIDPLYTIHFSRRASNIRISWR